MRYQNVIESIEMMIKNGVLSSGSKLPSVRILANELNCSKSTVLKAYDTMVHNRLAYVIDKTGYYLMNDPSKLLLSEKVDFSVLTCNHQLINKNELQIVFNKLMSDFEDESDDEGLFILRDTMKKYFRKRKIFTNVHDILIASNKQEAFHLIIQTLIQGSSNILVENPSDEDAVLFFGRKSNVFHFDRVNDSLDFNVLEYHFIKNNIDLMYLNPHHHLPNGINLSLEDKQKLLELCYRHQVYIIENNMFEDLLPYDENQSLYALDKYDIVFHLKSFNYIYSKHLNLVTLVMPREFAKNMLKIKRLLFGKTSHLEQSILARYLLSKTCDDNKITFDKTTKNRNSILSQTFAHYSDIEDIHFNPILGGTAWFVSVPSYYNMEMLIADIAKQNITIEPIHKYFYGEYLFKGFIISCASVHHTLIAKSLNIVLSKLIGK